MLFLCAYVQSLCVLWSSYCQVQCLTWHGPSTTAIKAVVNFILICSVVCGRVHRNELNKKTKSREWWTSKIPTNQIFFSWTNKNKTFSLLCGWISWLMIVKGVPSCSVLTSLLLIWLWHWYERITKRPTDFFPSRHCTFSHLQIQVWLLVKDDASKHL